MNLNTNIFGDLVKDDPVKFDVLMAVLETAKEM
jgi:hypothetical protein